MRRKSAKDKELDDRNRLARAWRKWHREQLEAALAGVHGAVFDRLMHTLKHLGEARELVDFIAAQDWSQVSAEDRLTALHEVNSAICKLRERNGLDPISDPLPSQPESAFRIIRKLMTSFPHQREKPLSAGTRADK
jgi:predicted ABC-class ATPase